MSASARSESGLPGPRRGRDAQQIDAEPARSSHPDVSRSPDPLSRDCRSCSAEHSYMSFKAGAHLLRIYVQKISIFQKALKLSWRHIHSKVVGSSGVHAWTGQSSNSIQSKHIDPQVFADDIGSKMRCDHVQ